MEISGGSVVKNPPAIQAMWVRSLGPVDPLEKETATHSSFLVWEILWIEEPGRLQSMQSLRVGHNLATKLPPPAKWRYMDFEHYFSKNG